MITRSVHLGAPGELPDLADTVNFVNTVIRIYVRTSCSQARHVERHQMREDGME
jgi:hypothetical protein